MELTSEQLTELKAVEKELLKSFVSVCDTLQLKYYLLEGSLLGTVRHKGFIPWDDDIDIGMPRKDYELFCSNGQKLLPEYYFVQTIATEKDYRANFAKIRDSRTTFIETSVRHCEINHGIYIDIFPLDYCLENEDLQQQRFREQSLMNARISMGFYSEKRKMSLKGHIAKFLSLLKYPTIRSALTAREKWMKALPKSDMYANYCSAWFKKEIIPVKWFGDGEYLEFEGLLVRVPKEYDKWLEHVYGNYMQPPPEDKRTTHHYADVIDVAKPYTFYRQHNNEKSETKR